MTKRLLFLFLLALPSPGMGQAILNVEGLQGEEVEGLHGEMAGRLRLASGNTDLFQVGGDLGAGLLTDHHWFRAYLGFERMERKGKDILDNRYLHLRYNYRFGPRLRTFHFFQIQANENLLLDRRQLLGSGLRYRLLGGSTNRLEIGSGIMWEVEHLKKDRLASTEDAETETARMSNLLVGSGALGDGNRWVTVVYYQPNVEDFGDYRLSGEFGIAAGLSDSLHLDMTLTWRHDSKAPGELEQDDVGLKTGFTYRRR